MKNLFYKVGVIVPPLNLRGGQGAFIFLFLTFIFSYSAFALDLPPIPSQYVYDEANVISAEREGYLNQMLNKLEEESSTQLVVAAVSSLQGTSIEDYSIKLAEKWKPGQKGQDNGVILLVAPNERKVRIEVGYGFEATLTDALSSQIIQNEIIPEFKAGDMESGIVAGVEAIINVVHGEYTASANVSASSSKKKLSLFSLLFICGPLTPLFFLILILKLLGRRHFAYTGHHGSSGWSSGSSWGSSGSSFGGGFSSGGGSFGGGGSSGSW